MTTLMPNYSKLQSHDYSGSAEHNSTGLTGHVFEGTDVARSDSMDITNDPRFFTDNVINYRLAAFNGLAVVSGFMIGNATDQVFDMNKKLELWHDDTGEFDWDGVLLSICMVINIFILFAMVGATYVGVVQPYHAYRLMTAGPRGFETCAAYYLDSHMIWYRHGVIMMMFYSLPLYLIQMGLRLQTKFERFTIAEKDLPATTPLRSQIQGIIACAVFCLAGTSLIVVHCQHQDVFKTNYAQISAPMHQMSKYMTSVMAPRAHSAATGAPGQTFSSWFNMGQMGPDV